MPTFLEFANCNRSDLALDASSLLPALRGSPAAVNSAILSEAGRDPHALLAVRTADWKLLQNQGEPARLYHLRLDPREATDVAAQYPDKVYELQAYLLDHLAFPRSDGMSASQAGGLAVMDNNSDAQVIEDRLRDLGYI